MADTTTKIDINRADVDALIELPGIGEALARRIINYRETVHPFEEVIELAAVPGITERMVRNFEEQVEIGAAPPAPAAEERNGRITESATGVVTPEPDPLAAEQAPALQVMPPLTLTDADIDNAVNDGASDAAPSPERLKRPVESPERDSSTTAETQRLASPQSPEARTTSSRPAQTAPRRGCGLILLGGLLGTFVGALLSLAVLAVLNQGTLQFTQANNQLRRELNSARQAQLDLSNELNRLNGQFETMATRAGDLATQQERTGQALDTIRQAVNDAQSDVTVLRETTDELDARLDVVADSAESFDNFLKGMRDLLFELQGPPSTPTATLTLTATVPPTATVTLTPTTTPAPTTTLTITVTATAAAATETVTPTSAVLPTRTPRATATPFLLSTETPQPQP